MKSFTFIISIILFNENDSLSCYKVFSLNYPNDFESFLRDHVWILCLKNPLYLENKSCLSLYINDVVTNKDFSNLFNDNKATIQYYFDKDKKLKQTKLPISFSSSQLMLDNLIIIRKLLYNKKYIIKIPFSKNPFPLNHCK